MNKIESILISNEALFLCIKNTIYNYNQYLLTKYKSRNNNLQYILNIFFRTYTISNNTIIQALSYNIILEYENKSNVKNKILRQYLKRFNYIYNKTYNQYESSKNFAHTNKIAIENLYIILKMKEKEGLLVLAKLLY